MVTSAVMVKECPFVLHHLRSKEDSLRQHAVDRQPGPGDQFGGEFDGVGKIFNKDL